jgi:monofunctional biosynthetic peptidoglycan transglycosylase
MAVAVLAAVPHILLIACRVLPPPVTPLMILRLPSGDGLERDWVPLRQIAPALPRAVVAAEDNRFCGHRGVDWEAMRDAWDEYWADERVRGASTITMQTARNLVLWPGRDVVRKGLEIHFARFVEVIWPKRRIVEVYLNIAEWGPGSTVPRRRPGGTSGSLRRG